MYTQHLKLIIRDSLKNLNFNKNIYGFYYRTKFLNNKTLHNKLRNINTYFFFLICWKKFRINYTGKGYRIRRYPNLNFIDFTFGACHFVKAWLPKYKLILKRKKSIIVYYKYAFFNFKNFNKITQIKLINLYTQRGLRNSKKIVLKKPKSKIAYN